MILVIAKLMIILEKSYLCKSQILVVLNLSIIGVNIGVEMLDTTSLQFFQLLIYAERNKGDEI